MRRRMLGPEIEGEIAQMSFGHNGLASAAGSTPAADTGSSLFDNDRGARQCPAGTQAVRRMRGRLFQGRRHHQQAREVELVIYYFRGICFERSKQWAKAEADLKKSLELFPDQPHVLNYLGYSWIDQGINLDEGMRMIKRAVEQRA